MSMFDRHLGQGGDIEIDGDTFTLKPLGTEYIVDIFKITKIIGKLYSEMKDDTGLSESEQEANAKETMVKFLSSLSDDAMLSLRRIIDATLKVSYPNEDPVKLSQFGMKYAFLLFPKIMSLNSASVANADRRKLEMMEKISDARKRNVGEPQ